MTLSSAIQVPLNPSIERRIPRNMMDGKPFKRGGSKFQSSLRLKIPAWRISKCL